MSDIRSGPTGKSTRRSRGLKMLALSVAAGTLVAACGSGASTGSTSDDGGDPVDGGVLRVAHTTAQKSFDPILGSAGYDLYTLYAIFDRLVNFDFKTLKATPGLAESWEYTTPTEFVLHLKNGVKFQDGTDMDAEAVKFTIERGINHPDSYVVGDLDSVESVEVVDPLTVKLNLSRADTALPLILADRAGMVVSPTATKAANNDLNGHPVGAGPFSFVKAVPNESLTLERFDDYWGEKAHLDGMGWKVFKDESTAASALLSGQADFLTSFLIPDLDRLKADASVDVVESASLHINQCMMRLDKGPFTDQRVRKAINLATDREAMNKVLNRGLGEPASVPLPSGHWAHAAGMDYEYDPDEAKKLLAEAGYEDGLKLSAVVSAKSNQPKMVEVMQSQFDKVGITLEAQIVDFPQAQEEFHKQGLYDLNCHAWSGRPDPYQTYDGLYSSHSPFVADYDQPDGLAELISATAVDQDDADRAKAFQAASEFAIKENDLSYFTAFRPAFQAKSNKVHGFSANISGKPFLNETLWMEK